MKAIILKIISIAGLMFLTYLSFNFGQLPLIEGKHLIQPYIDTRFAPNFTPEKFEKIKVGMTSDEVVEILGEPYTNSSENRWQYTGDGKHLKEDFAWYNCSIEFDGNQNVLFKYELWSHD